MSGPWDEAKQDEYMALVQANQGLSLAIAEVRKRMAALDPPKGAEYRIALRPLGDGDPMNERTPLDDIVVNRVPMFRAEDMGEWWWVCCYLDDDTHDRICWSVRAVKKGVIEWVTTEYPDMAVYEHDVQEDPDD